MPKSINLSKLYDTLDAVIVNFCRDEEISELKLQKGIFLFIWQYAERNAEDPMELLKQFQFAPYKEGPFSDYIHGQLEVLGHEGDLQIVKGSNGIKLKSSKKSESKYDLKDAEKRLFDEIRQVVSKTGPKELAFFIYYNPTIPKQLKAFFAFKSEMKDEFRKNKKLYLGSLLRHDLIDEDAYALMYNER